MARRVVPHPITGPILPTLPANELWAYDETTDRAFTMDKTTRDRLVKDVKAIISGRYTIPNSGSFLPAWQLTVKRQDREQAKAILGVTDLTT